MHDDAPDQPLTEHLVDQFAAYFVITMLSFYGYQFVKRECEKKSREPSDAVKRPDVTLMSKNER
jgi:hypothetical protein